MTVAVWNDTFRLPSAGTAEFAVVIPTYGRPVYLVEAVESVLAQTLAPAEIIVVCDGPGNSLPGDICRAPVRVIEQPHGGSAVARNTGIAAATADWVCFLDDDDLWHPDRLRRTAQYLGAHPECDAVTAGSWWFSSEPTGGIDFVAGDLAGCLDAAGRIEPSTDMTYLDIEGRSFDLLLERNRGSISGATVRRHVAEEAGGFPVGYSCAEDWLMFLNVARQVEWHFLDERLSFIRKHAQNNTSCNPTNGVVTLRAIGEVWADLSRPEPPHRPLVDYGGIYRWTVQNALWDSIRRRHFALARDTIRAGLPLLARLRDRAYVFVPPQITWRIEQRSRA